MLVMCMLVTRLAVSVPKTRISNYVGCLTKTRIGGYHVMCTTVHVCGNVASVPKTRVGDNFGCLPKNRIGGFHVMCPTVQVGDNVGCLPKNPDWRVCTL
jgi:hypothetical protein